MSILFLMLYLLAGVCFGLAAGNRNIGTLNTLALGLLLWVLVDFLQALQKFV